MTELPVTVAHDATAAVMAERRFGAGFGLDDLVYITVSTGIGAGIIAASTLYIAHREMRIARTADAELRGTRRAASQTPRGR